jgi:hypothetical protein
MEGFLSAAADPHSHKKIASRNQNFSCRIRNEESATGVWDPCRASRDD